MPDKGAVNPTDYTLDQAEDHIGNLIGQVDLLGEAHTMTDSTDTPDAPASGIIRFSATGQDKYTSSDGQSYNTGRLTLPATGSTTLTTSLQTVSGLTANMAVGTWRLYAKLLLNVPVTAGQGALGYQITASGGLTAANGRVSISDVFATNGVGLADYTTLGSTLTSNAPGTSGANRLVTMDAIFIVTVAGTFAVQAKQAATAAVSIVQYGTFCEIFPVT